MDNAPYDFIMNFEESDLVPFMNFGTGLLMLPIFFIFLNVLKYHYRFWETNLLKQLLANGCSLETKPLKMH